MNKFFFFAASTSDEKKQSAIAVVQNILVEANCSTEKSTTIVHSRDKKIIGLVVPSSRGSHSATLGGGANESGGNIFTFDSRMQLQLDCIALELDRFDNCLFRILF